MANKRRKRIEDASDLRLLFDFKRRNLGLYFTNGSRFYEAGSAAVG
ncbi:hypothetical protein SDC9_120846 [bioreactor metagenome]|uniref:Uncharacterized protein n=1 Tax=bioreactor metagenome TaxID=1076179 RepID=A0A645CAA6_9ZZZZ